MKMETENWEKHTEENLKKLNWVPERRPLSRRNRQIRNPSVDSKSKLY